MPSAAILHVLGTHCAAPSYGGSSICQRIVASDVLPGSPDSRLKTQRSNMLTRNEVRPRRPRFRVMDARVFSDEDAG